MTITEALEQRIERIRLPEWAEGARMEFRYHEDGINPWIRIVDPASPIEVNLPIFQLYTSREDMEDQNWEVAPDGAAPWEEIADDSARA